jgi:hypothetical protein
LAGGALLFAVAALGPGRRGAHNGRMIRLPVAVLPICLALSAIAGLAHADAVKVADDPSSRFRLNAVLAGAAPAGPLMNYRPAARIEGVTRTSVESHFGVRNDAVGEAGFLCGLLPHPDTAGAAAAFGHDPDGRFVGAKLRVAF